MDAPKRRRAHEEGLCEVATAARSDSHSMSMGSSGSSITVTGTSLMNALPPELLRHCLTAVNAPDLLVAAQVSRAFCAEASSDQLWTALYRRKWPPWTLLVPAWTLHDRSIPSLDSCPAQGESKLMYRRRLSGCLRLTIAPHVLALRGVTTDDYDGNETPVEVALCVAPSSRLSDVLDLRGKLTAQVHFGDGSLHNSEVVKCWLGRLLEAPGPSEATRGTQLLGRVDEGAPQVEGGHPTAHLTLGAPSLQAPPVRVEWREHSGAIGHWVYEGEVTRDGMEISGTFYLSILRRKRGRFVLRACDPATHVGDALGGLPTANQLVKRVAVKWCSAALAKKAAREELAAGV